MLYSQLVFGMVDYSKATRYFEKAAAQDAPAAINSLAVMADQGLGQPSSWRRARFLFNKAVKLGWVGPGKGSDTNLLSLASDFEEVRMPT